MVEKLTYRLKNIDNKGSWKLPTKDVMVTKKVGGQKVHKQVQYIPGSDSIFVEDYKGDLKPQAIWFENGKLEVPSHNRVLNELLKRHPWNGKMYELDDPEVKTQNDLKDFKFKRAASNMIDDADDDKIKAMAMGVYSLEAINWTPDKCRAKLFEKAFTNPKDLVKKLESSDYESHYLSALAFNKRIVKYNNSKTAVLWNSEDAGKIISLAKGENGIIKLGEFLSQDTEESITTTQEIGIRLQKL